MTRENIMVGSWLRSLFSSPSKRQRKRGVIVDTCAALESLESRVLLSAAPSNLTATAVSGSQVDLAWVDNSTDESGFRIEQSLDGSTGWTEIGVVGTNATRFTASGPFDPSTTYHFRVRAYFSDFPYHSDYSNTVSATTTAFPETPTGLTAESISDKRINLSWNDVADEWGYNVERSLDNNTWTHVGTASTTGSGTTHFVDYRNGLVEATRYYYRVAAYNGYGDSAYSEIVHAETQPATPTDLTATPISGAAINLNWTDNSEGETAYFIEQGISGSWMQIGRTEANITSFTATGPFHGSTDYWFRVRARSGSDNYSHYSEFASIITPGWPNPPAELTATASIPGSGIQLDWTYTPSMGYRIFRSASGTDNWSEIGTVSINTTVSFIDDTIPTDGNYIYRVVAFNDAGDSASAESEPVLALTADGDYDDDDLNNLDEYNIGTDPTFFDSDDDLLSDGWEVEYGLDPLNSDENNNDVPDSQDDNEGDGVNNLDESNYGTDPTNADTDGDLTPDGEEVEQGSDPNNPNDGGKPMADDMKGKLRLTVGDPSGSNSERWKLLVTDTGERSLDLTPDFEAPTFGQVHSKDVWLQAGESYEVWLEHRGSNLPTPDYDWRAWIEPTPGEELPYFIIDDNNPKVLQQNLYHGDEENLVDGKKAYLHIPLLDLDVDSDNNDGLDAPARTDEEDRLEQSPGYGKYVVTTTGDIDGDGQTDKDDLAGIQGGEFVPLMLSLSENVQDAVPTDIEVTFTYDNSILRIWTVDAHQVRTTNEMVGSGEIFKAEDLKTLAPGEDGKVILYVEAIAAASGAVPIHIKAEVDGIEWSGTLEDTVHMVVVSGGLTAYRPKVTTGEANNFDLFGLQAVDDDDETDAELGPGIRLNGLGDQDQNGEDDLIAIRIGDVNTPDGTFQLRRYSNIMRVFDNPDATGEIAFPNVVTGSYSTTDELLLTDGVATLWVAWDSTTHSTLDLELIDPVTGQVFDTITFHTFQSHVIMIQGFTQQVPESTGTKASAQVLYEQGYDVHLYEWDEQQDALTFIEWLEVPEEELQTAITDRGIEQFVMMGYSYGGGTVYDFAAELYNGNHPWINNAEFALSVYVDAIRDYSLAAPEDRKPLGSIRHANYYQTLDQPIIHGAATTEELDNAQILANELVNDELNAAGVEPGNGHGAIDSLEAVTSSYLGHIQTELDAR